MLSINDNGKTIQNAIIKYIQFPAPDDESALENICPKNVIKNIKYATAFPS